MLGFLASRETGVCDAAVLRRTETSRRIFNIELSKTRDVEKANTLAIVNSLDIDAVENRYLLSGGSKGAVAIHDLQDLPGEDKSTYRRICHIPYTSKYAHKNSVETVQWYPLDTGLFTTSGTDMALKVWDTNKLQPADSYQFEGIVYSHHMSPISTKHNLIAVGCDKSIIKLIDLRAGASTQRLKGHKSAVICVQWSPRDEFILASGSNDNGVLLWDVRTAKGCLMSLDQTNGDSKSLSKTVKRGTAHNGRVNGLTFTEDGLHLVTFGTDNKLRLWNTNSGKNCLVNYGYTENKSVRKLGISVSTGSCPEVVFVPDDNNVTMFDLHKGTQIKTLRGHYNQVSCCVYHRDKQELYSGGYDRNILVWLSSTDDDISVKSESESKIKDKTDVLPRVTATADTWSDEDED